MSYLEGTPESHVMTKMHMEPDSTFFTNWVEFMNNMQMYFGESNAREVEDLSLRAAGISLDKQKHRCENTLCYYCGEKGHFMKQCPKAKKQLCTTTSAREISFVMPDKDSNISFLADLFPEN
jgi:hypothetical protein